MQVNSPQLSHRQLVRYAWLLVFLNLLLGYRIQGSQFAAFHSASGVAVRDEMETVGRDKRQVSTDISGFNSEQRKELLDKHNELRKTRGASNMMEMEWDSLLERSAQDWANRCVFAHSPSRENGPNFRYVGENLYAGTGGFQPSSVVQMWFDEWKDYNYDRLSCRPGKMCGHYTQVVWAESHSLGCGVRYCHRLSQSGQFGFNKGYNVVCHYGPGGNIIGYKPYLRGRACSQCPDYAQSCADGLCRGKDRGGGSDSSGNGGYSGGNNGGYSGGNNGGYSGGNNGGGNSVSPLTNTAWVSLLSLLVALIALSWMRQN